MSTDLIFGFLCGTSLALAFCFGAIMFIAYKFANMHDEESGDDK